MVVNFYYDMIFVVMEPGWRPGLIWSYNAWDSTRLDVSVDELVRDLIEVTNFEHMGFRV